MARERYINQVRLLVEIPPAWRSPNKFSFEQI